MLVVAVEANVHHIIAIILPGLVKRGTVTEMACPIIGKTNMDLIATMLQIVYMIQIMMD